MHQLKIEMQPTQGVSYPRSGFEIAWKLAKEFFGDSLIFCDTNNTRWCGCESVPCINPNRTFAKNHDFGLRRSPGVPVLMHERYLIQYRTPIHSICSNFLLHKHNEPDQASLAGWRKFAFREISYWNHFVDKWIIDLPKTSTRPLICSYHHILESWEECARSIIEYLSADPIDETHFATTLANSPPVTARKNIDAFEYYDPAFFRELESATKQRMDILGLPSWDDV